MLSVWYSRPEWWSAIASLFLVAATYALVGVTFSLVVITGAAVFFGKRAADAAMEAFRLESEPVLVIAHVKLPPNRKIEILPFKPQPFATDPNHWYTIDRDEYGEIRFRRDVSNRLKTDTIEPPGAYLEIKNVGRSPAVGITMPIYLDTEELAIEELEKKKPTALLIVDAIAAQSSYFMGICNQLPAPVRFKAGMWATQVLWNKLGPSMAQEFETKPLVVLSQIFLFGSRPNIQ
jgi:hypothetical protein